MLLQQKLAQAFAVFDKDGSGFISVNAESDFRKQMTRPDCMFVSCIWHNANRVGLWHRSLGSNPFTDEQFENFLSEFPC